MFVAAQESFVINPCIGYIYSIMPATEFTVAEASWVTGLSVKAVNKAIEDSAVPVRIVRSGGVRRRYVPYASLLCLQLHAEGLKRLPLRMRREMFRRVLSEPQQKQLKYTDALIIDVGGARRKMSSRLQNLEKAADIVQSDPEIMSGAPVFRGTRIPVYLVADMIEQGTPIDEILEGYPSLTREMVEYAGIYATTHPRRGRPPVQPWSSRKPVGRKKGKLRRVA
jgi:uncharacterized protein (DUF433 family)